MTSCPNLRIKIFADGANKAQMLQLARDPMIRGLTTNPTLMRQAGVSDYGQFAREVLAEVTDLPISFEVFSDHLMGMEEQASLIASWGENVYVKIPVTNTKGQSTAPIQRRLARQGVKLNVTAIFTIDQVREVCDAIDGMAPSVVSVFAGRIADTGVDPVPMMAHAREITSAYPDCELLWASPREVLNIVQADEVGCDIITVTPGLLAKLSTFGKDLTEFSRETVQMFYDDACLAGYSLTQPRRAAA